MPENPTEDELVQELDDSIDDVESDGELTREGLR